MQHRIAFTALSTVQLGLDKHGKDSDVDAHVLLVTSIAQVVRGRQRRPRIVAVGQPGGFHDQTNVDASCELRDRPQTRYQPTPSKFGCFDRTRHASCPALTRYLASPQEDSEDV